MSKISKQKEAKIKPRILHFSIEGDKRFTVDFGERRRMKDALSKYGIRNKKKHKLRQQRRAMENTENYYKEKTDENILQCAKSVVREQLFRNYKETEL